MSQRAPRLAICRALLLSARGDRQGEATPSTDKLRVEAASLTDLNPDPNIVEVNLVASESTHEYLAGKLTQFGRIVTEL